MRRLEIPKRGGGVRVVFAPSVKEKKLLRGEMKRITAHTVKTLPHAHGFMPGRSALTCAMEHRGFPLTIGLDLKDFFPSVKPEMVRGMVPKDLNDLCWAGDGCGQGLPTAPMIANLAGRAIDDAVVRTFDKKVKAGVIAKFAYTRYADDLSLSVDPDPGQEVVEAFKAQLYEICKRCGFEPNKKKWRVQRAVGGRREIVGLLVGGMTDEVRPRRAWRRKWKALNHKLVELQENIALMEGSAPMEMLRRLSNEQGRLQQMLNGWNQWRFPKLPKAPEEKEKKLSLTRLARSLEDANKICKKAGLPNMKLVSRALPEIEEALSSGMIARVTSDPAYYIGISDFVTRSQSTSSCLRLGLAWNGSQRGQYFGAGGWWWHLRGVSIAHIVDPRNVVDCCGVKRPAQLARVLVFATRSGEKYYQARVYHGGTAYCGDLIAFLERNGYRSVRTSPRYANESSPDWVVGNVSQNLGFTQPYLDYGHWGSAKAVGSGESLIKMGV